MKTNSVATNVKTFEAVVYVTGYMPGTLKDWPQNIQDGVFMALEKLAAEKQLPLTIVHAVCEIDYGMSHTDDRPFIRIIASEIVAADARSFDPELMKAEFDKLIGGTLN